MVPRFYVKLTSAVSLVVVSQMVPLLLSPYAPDLVQPAVAKRPLPVLGDWKASLVEGERYLNLKELTRAEDCFRQAYKEVKKTGSADDKALCMLSLARVIYMQDTVEEPIPLFKKAIRLLGKAHGKRSEPVIAPLVELAGMYEYEGDLKKAAKLYSRAIDITAQVKGVESLAYGDYNHRLGRTKVKLGFVEEGEQLYLVALDVAMKQKKLPSSDILDECLSDYITALMSTDDRAKTLNSAFQAELLKDRIGDLRKKRGTPESNWSAEVSVQLADKAGSEAAQRSSASGSAVSPDGTTGSAVPDTQAIVPDKKFSDFAALERINQQRVSFYERMIAADIDALGADHPSVARDLGGLASIYIQQRKYEEAKPLLQRALVIYRNAYKDNSAPVRQTELLLHLIAEEQSPSTIDVDVSYINDLPKIPVEAQNLEVSLRLNDVAFMLYSQGKIDTALKVYSWAMASTAGATGPSSLLAAGNMTDFSRVLRLRGRATEAEKLEANARAIVRKDIINTRSKLLP